MAANITRTVDGKEYNFARMTMDMWGELEQWAKDHIEQDGVRRAAEVKDRETKELIIQTSICRSDAVSAMDNMGSLMRTIKAIQRMLLISLQAVDKSMTEQDSIITFDSLYSDRRFLDEVMHLPKKQDAEDGEAKKKPA